MAETIDSILPGLPDRLLVAHILPRLPCYTRPVCRALSKAWKSLLDTPDAALELRTRELQLSHLWDLDLVCTYADWDKKINLAPLIQEPGRGWIKLPEIRVYAQGQPRMVAWSGMIFVWTIRKEGCGEGRDMIAKLDIGRGKWLWDLFPVIGAAGWKDSVAFKGKLYSQWSPKKKLGNEYRTECLVYDMERDDVYAIAGKWMCSNVGITRSLGSPPQPSSGRSLGKVRSAPPATEKRYRDIASSSSSLSSCAKEDMYGFVKDWDRLAINVVRYDDRCNEWKIEEELPRVPQLEDQVEDAVAVKGLTVVNRSCFHPAMEVDAINVVMYREEEGDLMWCNVSMEKNWVPIEDELLGGGKIKDLLVVHGDLFAVSREALDQAPFFKEWVIWKGKIHHSSSRNHVEWKRMYGLPVGSRRILDQPPTKTLLCYTYMT